MMKSFHYSYRTFMQKILIFFESCYFDAKILFFQLDINKYYSQLQYMFSVQYIFLFRIE